MKSQRCPKRIWIPLCVAKIVRKMLCSLAQLPLEVDLRSFLFKHTAISPTYRNWQKSLDLSYPNIATCFFVLARGEILLQSFLWHLFPVLFPVSLKPSPVLPLPLHPDNTALVKLTNDLQKSKASWFSVLIFSDINISMLDTVHHSFLLGRVSFLVF